MVEAVDALFERRGLARIVAEPPAAAEEGSAVRAETAALTPCPEGKAGSSGSPADPSERQAVGRQRPSTA
jgi:hypothetical protein